MSYGPLSTFDATVASFNTFSTIASLTRGWKTVWLEVPTMTSQVDLFVLGSKDGTTFRRICQPVANSASPTINDFTITSSTTNRMVPLPNGFPYLKVEGSAILSNTVAFKVVCTD